MTWVASTFLRAFAHFDEGSVVEVADKGEDNDELNEYDKTLSGGAVEARVLQEQMTKRVNGDKTLLATTATALASAPCSTILTNAIAPSRLHNRMQLASPST